MLAAAEWWQVVGAFGTAAGAAAAAVGAIAAWRAASASRATSRDALEALAVGIRPRLSVEFGVLHRGDAEGKSMSGQLVAYVENHSEWPATDVTLDVEFRDGRTISAKNERIEPHPRHAPRVEQWIVDLADAPAGTPSIHEQAKHAVLRYSDERRIARYEQTLAFLFTKTRHGSILSTGSAIEVDERRI